MLIRAVAEYRIESAVPELISHIGYSLDRSTFPVGDRIKISALYPAAEALVKIGGEQLPELLLLKICREDDEDARRACAWVLREYFGKEIAIQFLKQAVLKEADDLAKKRVAAVVDMVASPGPIFQLKKQS